MPRVNLLITDDVGLGKTFEEPASSSLNRYSCSASGVSWCSRRVSLRFEVVGPPRHEGGRHRLGNWQLTVRALCRSRPA